MPEQIPDTFTYAEHKPVLDAIVARAAEMDSLPVEQARNTASSFTDLQKAFVCNLVAGLETPYSCHWIGIECNLAGCTIAKLEKSPWLQCYVKRVASQLKNPKSAVSDWYRKKCIKPMLPEEKWTAQRDRILFEQAAVIASFETQGVISKIEGDVSSAEFGLVGIPRPAALMLCSDLFLTAVCQGGVGGPIGLPQPLRKVDGHLLGIFHQRLTEGGKCRQFFDFLGNSFEEPENPLSQIYKRWRQMAEGVSSNLH